MSSAMSTATVGAGRDAGRSLLRSAARGAGLVGLAVIVGVVLLRVVDDGTSGPTGGGATTPTDTATPNGTGETLPTGGREPSQVLVVVLNAGQPSGSALNMTNQLRGGGYNVATPGNSTPRTGVAVQCQEGLDAEAQQLVLAVGGGAQVEPFDPNAPPAGAEGVEFDCIVLLGQG